MGPAFFSFLYVRKAVALSKPVLSSSLGPSSPFARRALPPSSFLPPTHTVTHKPTMREVISLHIGQAGECAVGGAARAARLPTFPPPLCLYHAPYLPSIPSHWRATHSACRVWRERGSKRAR